MTTATAQVQPNIAFTQLSQENTNFRYCKAGNPANSRLVALILGGLWRRPSSRRSIFSNDKEQLCLRTVSHQLRLVG